MRMERVPDLFTMLGVGFHGCRLFLTAQMSFLKEVRVDLNPPVESTVQKK